MSFSMQKLRSLLPGHHQQSSTNDVNGGAERQSVNLEPEVGFQISIEERQLNATTTTANDAVYQKTTVPELNVNLLAARHLPALFGFKIVQGYLIKVKLFPGSKHRYDSSIQTQSWPKFNENFKFPLVPEIKPSLKHSSRRASKIVTEFTPDELFEGHFVVFTVYALLELPPANFNRLSKTYRSLRDKSSNLVQKVVDSDKPKDDKENAGKTKQSGSKKKSKSKDNDNPRDAVPPLTISEARRNIGSVTCYLEPKIFKRNPRTGLFSTEELWLPIKDITKSAPKGPSNTVANSAKGIVELLLEVKDLSEKAEADVVLGNNGLTHQSNGNLNATATTTAKTQPTNGDIITTVQQANGLKTPHWKRMKQKIGMGGNSSKSHKHDFVLNVTTARMRCSHIAKDELEATAGSVYVKTSVFEHGIYIGAWKSDNFYPSLSTKWNIGDAATLAIPLQKLDSLENIVIRTTLATKTKMGKKLVLGTVLIGASTTGSGMQHMQLLRELPINETVPMWHCYQ